MVKKEKKLSRLNMVVFHYNTVDGSYGTLDILYLHIFIICRNDIKPLEILVLLNMWKLI